MPAGGRLAVLGRNGVGKTTLLRTLAGLTRRHAGTIRLGTLRVERLPTAERALGGLGFVPQGREIFRSLSVEENLAVGLKDRPRGAVEEAYELFPRLRERRRNLGHQLSGGEQQMLAIARALLGQPGLLLLDEPLEGLAPILADELTAAIRQLSERGETTIVLVEQRVEATLELADAVLVLERGRVVWRGAARDFGAHLAERHIGLGGMG